MKTYKLIKFYPGLLPDDVKLDSIIMQRIDGSYSGVNFDYINRNDVEDWPEFWQEVKEPLFKTHDGVEVFVGMEVWVVENKHACSIIVKEIDRPYWRHSSKDRKIFSTNEAAEKWIDENKPIFSKKMVRDALKKHVRINENMNVGIWETINYSSFIDELGL